jgi:DNA replication licensing factor MCM4
MSSQARSPFPKSRRGDVLGTGQLEKYLASENTERDLTSVADFSTPAPVIWGTTVTLEESMGMFRDFIQNYSEEIEPYYHSLLVSMNQTQNYNLNLDCAKIKQYTPTTRLFHQLLRYPQEVIPLMDHVLTDIFLEKFPDSGLDESQSLKVRPFNLPDPVNLRDLNPDGIEN